MFRPRIHSQAGTQSPFEHAFCVASIGFVLLLGSDRNPTTRTQRHAHCSLRAFFFSSSSSLLWSLKPRTDRSHVKDPCHLPPAFWCDVTWLAFSTYCYGRVASFFLFFYFCVWQKIFWKKDHRTKVIMPCNIWYNEGNYALAALHIKCARSQSYGWWLESLGTVKMWRNDMLPPSHYWTTHHATH